VVIARNYIENLREEVRKGMREKAEQGIYPSRPPLGYRNNKLEHTIEVDLAKAPIAKKMFDLYASGHYSLTRLRIAIKTEFGINLARGYLDQLLKSSMRDSSVGRTNCIRGLIPRLCRVNFLSGSRRYSGAITSRDTEHTTSLIAACLRALMTIAR
jgi:hypothetical protein